MAHALDHLFVMVRNPELAAEQARDAGLVVTHQRVHARQGTENVCFGFGDVFLELLWCRDEAEIRSPAVAPTGLAERSHWWDTRASPFGVCLIADPPPIPTWTYDVPFPPGMSVEMAATSARVQDPLVFFSRAGRPPVAVLQPLGARVTAVELTVSPCDDPSSARMLLTQHPVVTLTPSLDPHVTLTLDDGRRGQTLSVEAANLTIRL